MCRFEVLYLLSHQGTEGRREGGSRRALDKVVNSRELVTLLLPLLLLLTLRRARFARGGVELSWGAGRAAGLVC
jgi:hypothetical protein